MKTTALGDFANVYHHPFDSRSLSRAAYAEWAMVKICFLAKNEEDDARYLSVAIAYAERSGAAAWAEQETISPLIADVQILRDAWQEAYDDEKTLARAREWEVYYQSDKAPDIGTFDGYGAEVEDEGDGAFRLDGATVCTGTNCGVKLLCVYGADMQPMEISGRAFDNSAPLELRMPEPEFQSALLKAWPAPAEGWTIPGILAILNSAEAVAVVNDVMDVYVGAVWIGGTEV